MDANGLTAIDSTDIQRGNEGIDIGAWAGAPTQTERAPLPGHEHTTGMEFEPPAFGSYYAVRRGRKS